MADAKADLVLHDGAVLGHPGCDSLAIAGDRILANGTYSSLKGYVGPKTHMIRLGGRVVTPGFIDSHIHFMEGASVTAGVAVGCGAGVGLGVDAARCEMICDCSAGVRIKPVSLMASLH